MTERLYYHDSVPARVRRGRRRADDARGQDGGRPRSDGLLSDLGRPAVRHRHACRAPRSSTSSTPTTGGSCTSSIARRTATRVQRHDRLDAPLRSHAAAHRAARAVGRVRSRCSNARTESFHLGAEYSTIDLARELSAGRDRARRRRSQPRRLGRPPGGDPVRRAGRGREAAAPQGIQARRDAAPDRRPGLRSLGLRRHARGAHGRDRHHRRRRDRAVPRRLAGDVSLRRPRAGRLSSRCATPSPAACARCRCCPRSCPPRSSGCRPTRRICASRSRTSRSKLAVQEADALAGRRGRSRRRSGWWPRRSPAGTPRAEGDRRPHRRASRVRRGAGRRAARRRRWSCARSAACASMPARCCGSWSTATAAKAAAVRWPRAAESRAASDVLQSAPGVSDEPLLLSSTTTLGSPAGRCAGGEGFAKACRRSSSCATASSRSHPARHHDGADRRADVHEPPARCESNTPVVAMSTAAVLERYGEQLQVSGTLLAITQATLAGARAVPVMLCRRRRAPVPPTRRAWSGRAPRRRRSASSRNDDRWLDDLLSRSPKDVEAATAELEQRAPPRCRSSAARCRIRRAIPRTARRRSRPAPFSAPAPPKPSPTSPMRCRSPTSRRKRRSRSASWAPPRCRPARGDQVGRAGGAARSAALARQAARARVDRSADRRPAAARVAARSDSIGAQRGRHLSRHDRRLPAPAARGDRRQRAAGQVVHPEIDDAVADLHERPLAVGREQAAS